MRPEPLTIRAQGRWRGVLPALGLSARALSGKHGPCPLCGGKDRFRFDDKGGRGTWICSKCGAGDGIELVKRIQGVEFKEAARLIEQHIGNAPIIVGKGQQSRTDEQKRQEMRALWSRSKPITMEDAAGKYLNRRLGLTVFPSALRFSPDERYSEPGQKASWHPLMVAKVDPCDAAAAEGQTASLHRTYLDMFGNKADVASPRKMMATMPTGAAVRLAPHEDKLGIAEASRQL